MADFEVHVDLDGRPRPVGLARSNRVRGTETIIFEYDGAWLEDPDRFPLEPALALGRGAFAPPAGLATFGAVGDSAPDTWGRRLMQRAERRLAEREGRAIRTLLESDYLLGVADATRLGALRFRRAGDNTFQAPTRAGVPALIELGRLLRITERILRDEETDEDLQLIFAPGSSLGGARPKASVIDRHGRLSVAKLPKETDDYSVETWEEIALRLADRAGIATPTHDLIDVADRKVMLSRRFDRQGAIRIPFLSAMAMMGARDGERGSYPEIVDVLAEHGAQGKTDAHALYRRVVFNVLISNVDDHLRNHGFLRLGRTGWSLSPAYDLNPVPADLKARVLTTSIDLDEGTCSLDLLEAASGFFALTLAHAWYHCGRCHTGFSLRDRALGMEHTCLSPAALRMVGIAAAKTSFGRPQPPCRHPRGGAQERRVLLHQPRAHELSEAPRDGPVASGVVEGGCKHIVGARLRQGGMRWSADGANAIIALRGAIESNRFDDFRERRASTIS